jgi:hypothetical protein
MSILEFPKHQPFGPVFGPEEIKVLVTAFDEALQQLGLVNRNDPAVLQIAKHIIALAQDGELDPVRLRDVALQGLTQVTRPHEAFGVVQTV